MAKIKYNYHDRSGNYRFIHNKEGYFKEYEDGARTPMPRQRVPLRWQWKIQDFWWKMTGGW